MTVATDDEIVWFDISMNNAKVVDVLNGKHGLSKVAPCLLLSHHDDVLQVRSEVTTGREFHDYIQ